jgi:hypothetical protein
MRKPFAAYDPSPKRRPSFPIFIGFALKITHNLFGSYLFYLLYLILGAAISASMNCVGKTKPQMDADKRRCESHLRRMTPESRDAPAVSSLCTGMKKNGNEHNELDKNSRHRSSF